MRPNLVLWIYIVLLVAGGLMGYIKAKSRASLIASLAFAAALILCALGVLAPPIIADILLVALFIVFGMRFAKTKKFMPAGLMIVLTIAALLLRHV
jgi:uncharacterized membrane protein (UPF0136 family)